MNHRLFWLYLGQNLIAVRFEKTVGDDIKLSDVLIGPFDL
jgi:hypothetical protein